MNRPAREAHCANVGANGSETGKSLSHQPRPSSIALPEGTDKRLTASQAATQGGGVLIDLQDERRHNKPWLPADDRDVTSGLVTEDTHGKPACIRHGAMNRVDPHRRIYRCQEMYCGVGAEVVTEAEGRLSA